MKPQIWYRLDPARKAFGNVPMASNGLINRMMWKDQSWLNPTSDPDEAFFVGRNPA